MNINTVAWLLCVGSLIGTVLNARKSKISWLVWLVCSFGLFWINLLVYKFYAQAALWAVYCFLDLYGWITWSKKEN